MEGLNGCFKEGFSKRSITRGNGLFNKYCSGGPRLPKTSIVINDPFLQQSSIVILSADFGLNCQIFKL